MLLRALDGGIARLRACFILGSADFTASTVDVNAIKRSPAHAPADPAMEPTLGGSRDSSRSSSFSKSQPLVTIPENWEDSFDTSLSQSDSQSRSLRNISTSNFISAGKRRVKHQQKSVPVSNGFIF